MTTLEKLFVQIFERKNWIIEEVQRQADAYTEDLASRLLIDGITPPPSLLNQRFNSRSSDPHELKKEEIISKVLLKRPRDSVRYSTGGHSLYDKPVVARGNGRSSNEMCMETNTGLNVTNGPSKPNNDIGCSLTRVAEIDNSVNSPQNETDARISSIFAAPDSSLARIQRSKSRQKALELRNSGKVTAKSCLSKEDRTRISFTGDTISQNDFHQVTQDSEPDKCNDHSKTNDKEESGGKSSQQSGQADGVMEGANLADISLGSYGAKKSVTCKTHDTQRQSKLYSGRVTRSRGSSQQTNGITKSLELGTSVSCNSKEARGVLSSSLGDLKLGVDVSNKVQDADAVVAICSSEEVVISSNIAASRVTKSKSGSVKECPLEQEKAEIVVGNGPMDHVPVAVDSGKKLDPVVTMCTESDGLALKQSSECCMLVKPKQLNFDEPDGCDPNEISRKRKLDGLLGEECEYPSTSEQHLPMEGDVSRQWKSARTQDFDVEKMNENPMVEDSLDMGCDSSMDDKSSEQQLLMENGLVSQAEGTHSHEEFDEMINITNPMVDDVEHSSKVSPHDVAAILCGVDESAVLNSKPSFTSCLSKQGEMDSEACLDAEVRPSLAKELEHMTNSNLSTLKLNTWPRNPQRNVDNQSNHRFSDSHIPNTDAIIYCDLFEEASHDDSYLLSKSKKSQETTVAEVAVDDATLNQSGPNILNSDKCQDVVVAVTDEMMPVYEGFTINDELGTAIDFDTLDTIPSSTIERASIIEQMCISASTHTPFSQFSATFQQHQDQVQELYKFMPDGLVEDVSKHISETDCDLTEPDYTFPNQQTFDSVQFSGTPYNWQSKSYYSSPVGKFWDRSASSSGSSENRLSSNPELTCFPIEEDPDSNEEIDTDQIQENIIMKEAANEGKVLETVTDDVAVEIVPNQPGPMPMKYRERCSSNSVNVQVNVPKTHDKVKYKSKFHPGTITPSVSTRTSTRRNTSLQTQNSKTMRSGIKRPLQKDSKHTNIVSNITSFVSIVQQKQAAAVAPVKRDIKVKALEAAEAAKRREQEKENERKMKKEALKIERARVEKENAREMELNKKRKQEEMKKKEADVAARKKQREEDERIQVAKKRKIAEARKDQKVQHEKTRGGKNVVIAGIKKGSENVRPIKNDDERNDKSLLHLTSVAAQKETSVVEKSPGQAGSMGLTGQEPSYDISPYQCSDDEDEDEDDDLRTKKFVPSWASKKAVGMVLPLQHGIDPETIFPVGSFCSMDEVLLPRRLQTQ